MKDKAIYIRLTALQKDNLNAKALMEDKSITQLILDSVFPEDKHLRDFRSVLMKNDSKERMLENNINQMVRHVNSTKVLDNSILERYNSTMEELNRIKTEKIKFYQTVFKAIKSPE